MKLRGDPNARSERAGRTLVSHLGAHNPLPTGGRSFIGLSMYRSIDGMGSSPPPLTTGPPEHGHRGPATAPSRRRCGGRTAPAPTRCPPPRAREGTTNPPAGAGDDPRAGSWPARQPGVSRRASRARVAGGAAWSGPVTGRRPPVGRSPGPRSTCTRDAPGAEHGRRSCEASPPGLPRRDRQTHRSRVRARPDRPARPQPEPRSRPRPRRFPWWTTPGRPPVAIRSASSRSLPSRRSERGPRASPTSRAKPAVPPSTLHVLPTSSLPAARARSSGASACTSIATLGRC
jgi:hypothetical protein